jgi:hypothetical protein
MFFQLGDVDLTSERCLAAAVDRPRPVSRRHHSGADPAIAFRWDRTGAPKGSGVQPDPQHRRQHRRSGALALYVRTSSVMHSQFVEHVSPYNQALKAQPEGGWSMATPQALAHLEHEISVQAAVIAYTGDFWIFALVAVAALPLLLFIGRQTLPRSPKERAEALVVGE